MREEMNMDVDWPPAGKDFNNLGRGDARMGSALALQRRDPCPSRPMANIIADCLVSFGGL